MTADSKWYPAESLTHACLKHPHFSLSKCPIHQTILHDSNADGQRYVRPTCLECQGLKGQPARIVYAKPKSSKGEFVLHDIAPEKWSAKYEGEFRRRLMRLAIHLGKAKQEDPLSVGQLAKLIGGGMGDVISQLRQFETSKRKRGE